MEVTSFENEYARCWIDDGLLFFEYKKDVNIDIHAAKKIIHERTQFQNNQIYPLLTDIGGVNYFDKNARDYFASEGTRLIAAVAILVESPISRLIAKFYMSVNKPVVPTSIFTDRKKALAFLQKFREGAATARP